MAKVVMPLLSAEASGKIADTMVYFYWKGLNVVRRWVVPTNPRSTDQKKIRTRLAAMGKNLAAMTTVSPAGAIIALIKTVCPANTIWNAHFCAQTIDHIKTEGNWTTIKFDFTNATAAIQLETSAAALKMAQFVPGVAFNETVAAGLQLYLGAYAAYKLGLCGVTDYDSDPTGWDTMVVTSFAQDYTTA